MTPSIDHPITLGFALFRRLGGVVAGIVGLMVGGSVAQAISVTDTTGWNAWKNAQGGYITDPGGDQQTGQPADDFIGSSTVAAFQQQAGTLNSDTANTYTMFRARFGEYTPGGNGGNFSVGIDLTGSGKLNLIMRVSYKGSAATIDFAKPGTGANDAPSTSSWGTFGGAITLDANTFNYQAVTDGVTLNSNGTSAAGTQNSSKATAYTANAWATFAISYSNLQAAIRSYGAYYTQTGTDNKGKPIYTETANYFSNFVVNDYTGMSFVAFTSTQNNSINQDLLGTEGNTNSSVTFAALGAGSTFLRPGGGVVPEPATAVQLGAFVGVGVMGLAMRRRRDVRARTAVGGA